MKKILVYLGHPAHFHLYKNAIINWQANGHKVIILIKKKDVLENLLQNAGFEYVNILKEGRKDTKIGMLIGMLKRTVRLLNYCRKNKPDILTGTSVENSFVGKILGVPVINVNEDDASVVPLYAKLSYPFANAILNPRVCDSGKWNEKATKYESYQELTYLHPNHFIPDKNIVEKYFSTEKPYFIIRFAKLTAHHDNGIQGINTQVAQKLIDILKPYGDIYITSERELEPQFEQYRIKINPLDMHHVMAFAQLYIGDSQTMAAEAGVLGVPFVRFNDFVGRIAYLCELEDYYNLGFGIKINDVEKLYSTVSELVLMPNLKEIFQERRLKMLSEKIDYAEFLTWFIENYPESKRIMKENPDYQYNFK
jgi:predicted glycosyltransferase